MEDYTQLIEISRNKHGTLLTNFSGNREATYRKSLEYYNSIIPKEHRYALVIAEGYNNHTKYGLYYTDKACSGVDMSLFWDIYELVKANRLTLLNIVKELS